MSLQLEVNGIIDNMMNRVNIEKGLPMIRGLLSESETSWS